MLDKLRFFVGRIRTQLWARPLAMRLISLGGVFLAKILDDKIARLGLLGHIIEKVETATAATLERLRKEPRLGAGVLEASIRLQKSLGILAQSNCDQTVRLAKEFSRRALQRSESALNHEDDRDRVRECSLT